MTIETNLNRREFMTKTAKAGAFGAVAGFYGNYGKCKYT